MRKEELLQVGKSFGIQKNDTKQIIMRKTGLSQQQFFLRDNIELSQKDIDELRRIFKKLSFGYPIEYVLEKAEFYGKDFFVDKRCLIPRNDTEVMVDEALKEIGEHNKVNYIDVGTGSGAISISIMDNVGQDINLAYALDISKEALDVAKKNMKSFNLVDKIKLFQSDLLETILSSFLNKSTTLVITANLPYIKDKDFGNMDKEVILHEPAIALYGGEKTGFELYEKLIFQVLEIKKSNIKTQITLFIEIGFDQKEIAEGFLKNQNLIYKVFKDKGGVERCVKIEF